MTITRSQITKELIPGLNTVFGLSYGEIKDEYKALFEIENSNRSFEEEVLFTGLGQAPTKQEGAAIQYDDMQESFTARYIHETIALGFAITEEAFEDNLYDTFTKQRAKALGRAMATTKEVKAANVFNFGFNALYPGGDGVALFSSAHPTVGDGNQSNTTNTDLAETALENATISVSLLKDDRGILIAATSKSLHIPPQLQFVAKKVLDSDLSTTTTTNSTTGVTNVNDINALKRSGYFRDGVFMNHRFTDSDAWFIKTDVPNGTKMFIRKPLATAMEGDFDTGNMRFKARERYSFGWSDWRGWYGSTGA